MRGRPILIAVAAFIVVLLGGAALAGVGATFRPTTEAPSAATDTLYEEKTSAVDEPAADEPVEKRHPESEADDADHTSAPKPPPGVEESVKQDGTTSTTVAEKPPAEEPEPVVEEDVKESAEHLFTIDTPAPESHVTSKVVRFAGTVEPGVSIHRGKYQAQTHDGEWAIELVLSAGKNRVGFAAIAESGRVEERSVTVFYDAPDSEEPPKDHGDAAPFVAKQSYGSCSEPVPYDVFYGEAAPGARIKAVSPYGSGATTANDDGRWEMKVEFPTAPPGKPFEVTLTASSGGAKTFRFVNTGGSGESHDG